MSSQIHWLGTTASAKYLGLTPRTLYRLVNEGRIPAFRLGRVIRLRQDDLDKFIERSRIAPGTLDHLCGTPQVRAE